MALLCSVPIEDSLLIATIRFAVINQDIDPTRSVVQLKRYATVKSFENYLLILASGQAKSNEKGTKIPCCGEQDDHRNTV